MSPLVPYTEKGANFSSNASEPDTPKPHLLYAHGKQIRLHLDGENKEFLIAERRGLVYALALHDNRLVDGGDYRGIRYTETGKPIAKNSRKKTSDLTVHDKHLLYSNGKEIRYAETGEVIAKCPDSVFALAIHNNRLVDASYDRVLYTDTGEVIAKRSGLISALAVYNNRLIDAGWYNGIFYTEEKKKIVNVGFIPFALLPIDEKTADRLLTLPWVEELE
jgi:hypothetical protein